MQTNSMWSCLRSFGPYFPMALVIAWWLGDLQYHWRELPEYHFGWVVVLLTSYLILERWQGRPRTGTTAGAWTCLGLACLGTPFVLIAELYKQAIGPSPAASFCLSMGCVLFLISNLANLHGWVMARHFLFPLAFFCLAVPLPGLIWTPIVMSLKTTITLLNVETLNLLGVPALQQTNVIQLPTGMVGIDEACSGVRSLQSSLMIGLFIGDLTLGRSKSKWVFCLGAVLLALTGNFARSLFLSLTAYFRGTEALRHLHDGAGWSVFVFTAIGLALLGVGMRTWEKASTGRMARGEL